MHVVVGDWSSPAHDAVGPPVFLPDGRIAYAAVDGLELWWRVATP